MQQNRPIPTHFIPYKPRVASTNKSTKKPSRKQVHNLSQSKVDCQNAQLPIAKHGEIKTEDDDDEKTLDDTTPLNSSLPVIPADPVNTTVARRSWHPGPSTVRLNMLALKPNSVVQNGVRHYLEIYAPFCQHRPEFASKGTDHDLLRDLVPFTLQSPMLLSATVAMMELIQNMGRTTVFARSNTRSLQYSTAAVKSLQRKIASSETQASDEVIMTILILTATEFYQRKHSQVYVHLQALSRMIQLRGGIDKLGFDGYIKYTALSYLAYFNNTRFGLQDFPPSLGYYPTYPYSPEICEQIAVLPLGLARLATDGRLCSKIIQLCYETQLDRPKSSEDEHDEDDDNVSINTSTDTPPHTPNSRVKLKHITARTALALDTIGIPGLSTLEQCINLALMAFCIYADDTKKMYRLLTSYVLVHTASILHAGENLQAPADDDEQRACLVWAGTMMIAMTRRETWSQKLGFTLLEYNSRGSTWGERVKICERYFWDEGVVEHLAMSVRELQGMAKPAKTEERE